MIQDGYCKCGCGGVTGIAKRYDPHYGTLKGQHRPYKHKHRERTSRHGRFWKFVNKADGCWNWIGTFIRGGYGAIGDRGSQTKISEYNTGRKATEEARLRMSIAQKKSAHRLGSKATEETRLRMSIAQLKRRGKIGM